MIRRVQATVLKFGMLRRGDHVLAAISGGADSVALLHVLRRLERRWELRLTAAHLNHGLRGEESDEDEAFVLRLGEELGVPVVSERWQRPQTGNLEQAARRARYAFLRRAAASAGATRIAVGHTRDDQAETVLLRILRGSGSLGLAGIHPVVDDLIVRPLIEVSRAEIERFLTASGISWRSDSSNSDLRYRRNRIRHELLPLLRREYNPRIDEVLARGAAVARESAAYLEEAAKAAYEGVRRDAPGGVALDVPSLLRLHPALRRETVRLALRECRGSLRGIDAAHVEAALLLARAGKSGRSAQVPGAAVSRQFDRLVVCRAEEPVRIGASRTLAVPGRCELPEIGAVIEARTEPLVREYRDRRSGAVLAADRLTAVLTVRGRLPGDRYGGPGHRKVKKMLADARIPLHERDALPVVVAGDAVVWIPGFLPAKEFAAGKAPAPVVVLEMQRLRP